MTNDIVSAVSRALYETFGGDYEVHKESIEQGLQEPCFLISALEATREQFLGRRYFRTNPVVIYYFPNQTTALQYECAVVKDRLWDCLELIDVDGVTLRGTGMSGQVTDDVLAFYVSYNLFVRKGADEETPMETLAVVSGAKE